MRTERQTNRDYKHCLTSLERGKMENFHFPSRKSNAKKKSFIKKNKEKTKEVASVCQY